MQRTNRLPFVGLLALAACQTTLDVNPAPSSPPFPASNVRIQSETAFGVARRPEAGRQIVLAFNDYSDAVDRPGEIFVEPSQDLVLLSRGASLLGWSFSRDDGTTWSRGGKVRPPPGFAVIVSDPAVAVDPKSPSTVYLSSLAVSDTAWRASAPDLADDVPRNAAPDSFCVARSTDGGTTFPTTSCTQVSSATSPERGTGVLADIPSIVVDGLGCLWVAVEEKKTVLKPITRLFRARRQDSGVCGAAAWESLERVEPVAAPGAPGIDPRAVPLVPIQPREVRPRLRTDGAGDVWLMTEQLTDLALAAPHTGVLRRFSIPPASFEGWNAWTPVGADCSTGADGLALEWTGSTGGTEQLVGQVDAADPDRLQKIRGAYRHDFDVVLGADGTPQLRFVVANQVPATEKWFLQIIQYDGLSGVCDSRLVWSTAALAGGQSQPSLRHTVADPVTGSAGPDEWSLVFLTSGAVKDPTRPQIRVQAATVGSGLAPIFDLTANDFPVCATTQGYWGDYAEGLPIATGATTRTHLAATSDSRGALCARGALHALPQHVRVTRW
jgi:hypothetical protein